MDEWGAGTMLRDLVATEPPPSRVDAGRVISGAKRRRRRRRRGMLLAAVVVVAVGVVAALLPGLRSSPTPVATTTARLNPHPPFRFDPAHFQLRLDWQPGGVTRVEHESDGGYQRITLVRTVKDEQEGTKFAPIASIDVYGTGQVSPDERVRSRRTADIYGNGNSSHWI